MILYLYGPDSYRLKTVLREKIVSPFKQKHPSGLVGDFYLSKDGQLVALAGFFKEQGLFSVKKMALVYEPEEAQTKELKPVLMSALEDKEFTLVVVAEKKLPKAFDF